MHQPRPYGLFGDIHSDEDGAAVEALVRRLTNIKSTGKLDALKLVRTLPGGGVAIAIDMGGTLRVIVQNPKEEERPEADFDGVAGMKIPMLFSGVVKRAVLRSGQGLQLELTDQAQRRLGRYGSEKVKPVAKIQDLLRFAIEYSSRHIELAPKDETSLLYTQYAALRSSWFSGSMAAVAQVAGGYGKQDFRNLPDTPVERAQMILPTKVAAKVSRQLGNVRLPGYKGVPPESGQIQFDYKFQETHGVCFGSDSQPWIVRVNTRGVYAMPLPLVPATTTEAFRAYVEEVEDSELQWLLDRFGGMPSGEGFPVGAGAFEAWRRAGVIIKIADVDVFYGCLAYSSACGWAFSSSGREAFNTCYEFDEGDGLQRGHAYKMRLSIGPLKDHGRLPTDFDVDDPEDARLLNAYLSALYRQMTNKPEHLAVKYKLRRVDFGQVLGRARSAVSSNAPVADEIDYWNNLESNPIAKSNGSVSRVGSGIVWAPGLPKSHPQIKFAEPWMDGCISHDFGRMEGYPAPSYVVRCDTIMYGYYVDDELKVVKYFRDPREYTAEVEDDYEDCMIVGAWQRTTTSGSTRLFGHFYTSDIDERKAAAPITTVTKTVGTDLGYDTKPMFTFDYVFATSGKVWRNRYFQHVVNSETSEGYGMGVAVCVPYLNRGAMFHALRESNSGSSKSEARSMDAVEDPNSYRHNTYDFIWAWSGTAFNGNMGTAERVSPSPKDGNPVYIRGYNYFPGGCSDFADQGDWMGGLPQDYTWLIHPDRHVWQHSGGGGPPTVKPYSYSSREEGKSWGALKLSITEQPMVVNKEPNPAYFMISPDEFGNVFYVDAIKNMAGETAYANTSEKDPQAPKQRTRFGFSRLADHKSAHHFMGVINE